jgi:mono/diheme cytochrome c family protein
MDLCREVTARLVALLVATLAACSAVVAQSPSGGSPAASTAPGGTVVVANTSTFSPEQMALGRKIYGVYCTRCHGINMIASSSAFFDLRTFPPDSKERFLASLNNGIRAMPAWKDTLKPEEMESLWAYVIGNKPK